MSNKTPIMAGPWRGMDLRETGNPLDSYFLGINVDTSNGLIEARAPMRPGPSTCPAGARLHVVDRPGIPRILLSVGQRTISTYTCSFRAFDATTLEALGAIQNLSAIGEPEVSGEFLCSFVDTFLNPTSSGVPRPVTLIVTAYNTYVFEASVSTSTVRLLSVSDDSFRINSVNYSYWTSRPRGPIAELHQSRVFYAGFPDTNVVFDNPLESVQNAVPEANLGAGRATLTIGPCVVAWSDEYDPAGIRGDHFLQVDQGERITGLHSIGEALLIFTETGIYILSGYSDDTYQLTKVQGGVGCIAHNSIVQVGSVTYFMAVDGVYAFGGLAAPEVVKLSSGLDPMWLGWGGTQTNLPDAMQSRVGAWGWPFSVVPSALSMCNGCWYPRTNQIWWSLPTTGAWGPLAFPITLVYDVENRGFNLYLQPPSSRTDGAYNSCMTDAVVLEQGQRLVTSNRLGDVQEYGVGIYDGPVASTSLGVPLYWSSGRLYGEGVQNFQVQCAWFKLLCTGKVSTAQGGSPATVGSESVPTDVPAYFVEGEEVVHDAVNDLGVAPGYDGRKTITAQLKTHPNADGGDYFYGVGVWGTAKWSSIGWFTARASCQFSSRTFRLGVIDDPGDEQARGNMVHVAAVQLELSAPLGTRR